MSMNTVAESAATDEQVLEKLQTLCARLGQPSHDVLPMGAPRETCCVFGCALNGAVYKIKVDNHDEMTTDRPLPYGFVDFYATSESAAEAIADVLGGIRTWDSSTGDKTVVSVRGDDPAMLWMRLFDAGLKPHLVSRDPDGEVRLVDDEDRHWTALWETAEA